MKKEIVSKDGKSNVIEVVQTPIEGKLFEVNPLGIDRSLFEKARRDKGQEVTRQMIQEAFVEVDKHPEKYADLFYTLIPEKECSNYQTPEMLQEYANDLGGYMADWVEQALEWAQRIFNGERWKVVCNDDDKARFYRMIVGKNGEGQLVGSSQNSSLKLPASFIYNSYISIRKTCHTVPLVVFKTTIH